MYVIGVFPGSYGGDIAFLLGIVQTCGKLQ